MFAELVEMAAGKFVHRVAAQIVQEAAGVLSQSNNVQTQTCGGCHRSVITGSQCACGFWN